MAWAVQRSDWYRIGWSGLGGLLLFLADYPLDLQALTLVAFVPFLCAIARARTSAMVSLQAGVWTLARVAPLGWALHSFGLPLAARALVCAYLLALDLLFAWIVFLCRNRSRWAFALAAGFAYAAIEYADSLLPMWGTARGLARLLVDVAGVRHLVFVVGAPGVALALVATQAFAAKSLVNDSLAVRSGGVAPLFASLLLLLPVAARPAERVLRVAAVGWGTRHEPERARERIAAAAAQGALLVVFPEAAFTLGKGQRRTFAATWAALAAEQRVFLVVPFIDADEPGNRVWVFGPDGQWLGQYTKRHLVPLAESGPAGSGEPLTFDVRGVRVGVMICHDDNFTDVARAYAQRHVALLVVPTFEGPRQVAPYHFANSRLRAAEQRIALLRATAQGSSAAIAPGGDVVRELDHDRQGGGVLVVDVPISAPPIARPQ